MIKIPIKLYYTSDGELFTQGNLNNVPMLNRLSNFAYSLFLITPVKPYETLEESSEKATIVNVYFEKGDGTQSEQYPMAWVNRVPVKVRNTEEEWNVYKCDISDDVLTISSFEHDNTLGIGFSISIPTGSTTNDGEQIYQTLNYSPYYTACNYTITGNARIYDDFTLDIITEYLNTMLKTKINNIDGITKTDEFPTLVYDSNDVENYNVGKLFIVTKIGGINFTYGDGSTLHYDEGTIFFGDEEGSWHKIVDGADYIEALKQRIAKNESDIVNLTSYKVEKITKAKINSITYEDNGKVFIQTDDIEAGRIFTVSVNLETGEKRFTELAYAYNTLNNLFEFVAEINSRVQTLESDNVTNKANIEANTNDIEKNTIDISTNKSNIETNTTNIDGLRDTKLDKVFNDLAGTSTIGDNYYFVLNTGTNAVKISWENVKNLLEEGDHFKGDYTSYEQLVASVSNPKNGDYAYVDIEIEGSEDMVLYIWDEDDQVWRMSSASQFLKATVFTAFQQEVINGIVAVGKAKGYTEDGEIGQKFSQLEKQTIEFSDTVEEGNELSPTVKQIKLGDDIWLIPEGKGVVSHTGAELEEMEFEEGRIYLCTESSDSFQLNQLYYGDNDKNIRKLTSSLVSLEPALTTFTLSSPTGTMEVGTSVSTVSYSFGLKYPNKLVNAYSELYYGSNLVDTKTSLSTSNSGSVSYSILNSTVGTKNFTLKIYSNGESKFSSSKSYSVAQRYYYGIASSDVNAETLTTDLANTNFQNVKDNSNLIKTSLSKLSSVTLSIPTNSYVWFLVPTSTSINSATSGGFDFPYQLQGTISMTNSYGIELNYKVYRSSNQVYGDMTIALS